MMYVICFYWIGDRWHDDGLGERYINNLYHGVRKNLSSPFEFVCFTNEELRKRKLNKNIIRREFEMPSTKGVLPRMFMFSDLAGLGDKQVLALDLDIVITGSLDDLAAYDGAFCSRSKFKPGEQYKLDGDVTSFRAGPENEARFWTPFEKDPERIEELTGGRERYWFREVIGERGGDRWDKLNPGQVVSYKRHVKSKKNKLPKDARIVSCHGKPRPHEITNLPWVKRNWK